MNAKRLFTGMATSGSAWHIWMRAAGGSQLLRPAKKVLDQAGLPEICARIAQLQKNGYF